MSSNEPTILIADDSPVQAIFLRRILQQNGFNVLTAKNGEEALSLLENNSVDLVISDVNMPKMDGYELCKHIKLDEKTMKVPIILCTTLSQPESLIRGIEVGADSYITRPFGEEEIVELAQELLHMPPSFHLREKKTVHFNKQHYEISTSPQHIFNFLLSTYRNILRQKEELSALQQEMEKMNKEMEEAKKEQESILHNILPVSVANQLIAYGTVEPTRFEEASVLFVDFKGFSKSAKGVTPQALLQALGLFFDEFDQILSEYHVERIKTIGDGYMAAAGVPNPDPDHAAQAVRAGLGIVKFIDENRERIFQEYGVSWEARVGINSGPVVAGVVGQKRFAYDIWGETVNLASRMESHGIPGKVNISKNTYEKVVGLFTIQERGKQPIRGKAGIERIEEMYLVDPEEN